MAGNVWEWTSDWYRADYYSQLASAGGVARNPQGPDSPFDPSEPIEKKRVHRGGSFLCTDQVLFPLHGRHARQGRRQHRDESRRLPPGESVLSGRFLSVEEKWLVDGYAGLWLFGTDPSFYPGTAIRTQTPIATMQTHISYSRGLRGNVADVRNARGSSTKSREVNR